MHLFPSRRTRPKSQTERASRRQGETAVGLVEFSLVAPIALLMLLFLIVAGVTAMNQNRLSNSTRDAVRSGGICGGVGSENSTYLPSGTLCSDQHWQDWVVRQFKQIDGGFSWKPQFLVVDSSGTTVTTGTYGTPTAVPSSCKTGDSVVISVTYNQSLFVPIVGQLFANGPNNTRKLSSQAEALCEQ